MRLVVALLFAAVIAPTDPVAVMSILRRLKVKGAIKAYISGESLFNDATAIVVFLLLAATVAIHAAPTANTTLGPLIGATEHVGATVVNVFRGVPFAASTGGANRWRPPQPRAPWSAPRSATANGPAIDSSWSNISAFGGDGDEHTYLISV